jgi:hypothetical protein
MWVVFLLLCCCQTLLASQLDDSPIIQALADRITLLELNMGKHQPEARYINEPTSDAPEKNGVRPKKYRNLESKIRSLEEKLSGHGEVIIQLKNSQDRIDTLEKTVRDLVLIVTDQKKEINRVRGLKAKVHDQGRTIAYLRKRTFDCERLIFNWNTFQDSAISSDKILDSQNKSRGNDVKEEKYNPTRRVRVEKRGHSPQGKLKSALYLLQYPFVGKGYIETYFDVV